jgi:hypothetical protein
VDFNRLETVAVIIGEKLWEELLLF